VCFRLAEGMHDVPEDVHLPLCLCVLHFNFESVALGFRRGWIACTVRHKQGRFYVTHLCRHRSCEITMQTNGRLQIRACPGEPKYVAAAETKAYGNLARDIVKDTLFAFDCES
ncbi:MAG: hypothetical protein WBL55_26835, partial [Xanthobacteraceae bacterium]